ncbi:hypothetical protein ROZALSC1DRAFT_28087 [Rozella allomycis CSF55]|uniref:ABC transporter domain-containing protein n=1 Tax=Rozella allomycis (strain CSF55) TaxID=988480 RepID=A0A4P9YLP7_ROZAC|nr:hypothetical protein ROZALSC1DRAFT_28087 [Rozella allomycis CSF55]
MIFQTVSDGDNQYVICLKNDLVQVFGGDQILEGRIVEENAKKELPDLLKSGQVAVKDGRYVLFQRDQNTCYKIGLDKHASKNEIFTWFNFIVPTIQMNEKMEEVKNENEKLKNTIGQMQRSLISNAPTPSILPTQNQAKKVVKKPKGSSLINPMIKKNRYNPIQRSNMDNPPPPIANTPPRVRHRTEMQRSDSMTIDFGKLASTPTEAVAEYTGFELRNSATPESFWTTAADNNTNDFDAEEYTDDTFVRKKATYPYRALFRKTLSYQKNQMFVNVCCIFLCPALMIIISFLMALIINSVLDNLWNNQVLLQCSNVSATDPDFFPEFSEYNLPEAPIYQSLDNPLPISQSALNILTNTLKDLGASVSSNDALRKRVRHANWMSFGNGVPFDENFRRKIEFGTKKRCVYWFGDNYPFSYPYALDPKANSTVFTRDSTFRPDPPKGWFGNTKNPNYVKNLLQEQFFMWFVYSTNGMKGDANIGTKTQISAVPLDNIFQIPTNFEQSGLLGAQPTQAYFSNETKSNGALDLKFRFVPFFERVEGSDDALNLAIANSIASSLQQLSKIPKDILFQVNPATIDVILFVLKVNQALLQLPYGGVLFKEMDSQKRSFKYLMQVGNDRRISQMNIYPSEGLRRIILQSYVSNMIFRSLRSNSIRIVAGLRVRIKNSKKTKAMPTLTNTRIALKLDSFIGGILYPFGISFLLPVFVFILLKEKEDKIAIMMKMNGLKSFPYYATHFIHFYILQLISSLIFIIVGVIFQMEFFIQTDPGVYVILFLLWNFAMISLSFFLSLFFDHSRTGVVVTFLVLLCGVVVNLAATMLFDKSAPLAFFIWPPLAFYRALTVINIASFTADASPYKMSSLTLDNEVSIILMFLAIEGLIFLILTVYFSQILDSNFGVSKPWYFPVEGIISVFKSKKPSKKPNIEKNEGDKYVIHERRRVELKKFKPSCPLVIYDIHKIFGNKKNAVCGVSLSIDEGSCFGLLGPNGAGKTTLISMLTGLYKPTFGTATIAGIDLNEHPDLIFQNIGVCPQYDILWPDLTVEDHLLFYARLKGVQINEERKVVQDAMRKVALQSFEKRKAKSLSGGEKRRLSIAIAMLNNPKVVFLDEPTTGLDPEVRRFIWNIINNAKKGTTIILTTHSMEEADVLCSRIGIMAKGTLRCIASDTFEECLWGRVQAYIYLSFKVDSYSTTASYEFTPDPGTISRLFEHIELRKKEQGIQEWGLSQTSLDEVFLNIVQEDDADA